MVEKTHKEVFSTNLGISNVGWAWPTLVVLIGSEMMMDIPVGFSTMFEIRIREMVCSLSPVIRAKSVTNL